MTPRTNRLAEAGASAAVALAAAAAGYGIGRGAMGSLPALAAGVGLGLVLGLAVGFLRMRSRERAQTGVIRNLSQAIEQSHSAVMITDLESRIEYANSGLCRQIGYPREELIGRSWREFQQPETPPELLKDLVDTVRSGRAWHGEWYNRRKSGELYAVRGVVTPVLDDAGKLVSFVTIFEDRTESRRQEEILREALVRAESGDRAKSRFLATMSHEMRTPLNGITGFTTLLLETPLNAEQGEYVQSIRTSGEALIQLTGDILDLARIEAGNMKLEKDLCDPRQCVEDALDVLAVPAASKGIELLHWVDPGVPGIVIADQARLRQVLVNLVGNAVKFTEKGEVEVTLGAERKAEPGIGGNWVLSFTVRDTGIGISAENRAKLFQPFSQVDASSTRRFGGTGLGLAISKNLVQLMGGQISVESSPGSGSTFSFTLLATAGPTISRGSPDLARRRFALVAPPGPFRREFSRLAARWGSALSEFDSADGLAGGQWDAVFVELDEDRARSLPPSPPWRPERTYAIVPTSLPKELRAGLRSRFCILLNKPLRHEALPYLLAETRTTVPAAERPAPSYGLRALVAEDHYINQRLVEKILGNLGCASTLVDHGRAALEELARAPGAYDLVLMDLHMPVMDGLTAIERIRAGEAGEAARKLWIAAVTADAQAEQRERVMAAGADDYIVKPINLAEIEGTLRRCAERGPAK
jgi:PAS domain S-box-containing protein